MVCYFILILQGKMLQYSSFFSYLMHKRWGFLVLKASNRIKRSRTQICAICSPKKSKKYTFFIIIFQFRGNIHWGIIKRNNKFHAFRCMVCCDKNLSSFTWHKNDSCHTHTHTNSIKMNTNCQLFTNLKHIHDSLDPFPYDK